MTKLTPAASANVESFPSSQKTCLIVRETCEVDGTWCHLNQVRKCCPTVFGLALANFVTELQQRLETRLQIQELNSKLNRLDTVVTDAKALAVYVNLVSGFDWKAGEFADG